jgi:hypothetical protein
MLSWKRTSVILDDPLPVARTMPHVGRQRRPKVSNHSEADEETLHALHEVTTVRRNDSFSTVDVRENNLTLGDHPTCGSYPLALDWQHTPPLSMTSALLYHNKLLSLEHKNSRAKVIDRHWFECASTDLARSDKSDRDYRG